MQKAHTIIGGIRQSSVGDERDGGMKTLRITQAIHDHVHLLAPQLIFNPFESSFEREPEVDLL